MKRFFLDGAFGTYYRQVGAAANGARRQTSLTRNGFAHSPGVFAVRGRRDKTNTFAVRPSFSENWRQVLRAGYRLAEEAAGEKPLCSPTIGSIQSEERAGEEYLEVAREFCACGAKNFLFETLAQLDDLLACRGTHPAGGPRCADLVSFAAFSDGYTQKGCDYKDLLRRAAQVEGIEAVGLNCVCGPSHVYRLLSQMDRTAFVCWAMPNAGYPPMWAGVPCMRTIPPISPPSFVTLQVSTCRF